ncbi:MAG: arylesterase [Bacteroidia bacterium]|nr:arylesterase [Bacteroidia bacterium]
MRFFLLFLSFCFFAACASPEKETDNDTAAPSADSSLVKTTVETDKPVILFFGNSLTAGYGLELSQAFPALIQNRLDSLSLEYTVINAGLSGETTASGKNRVDWLLKQKPAVFVLELGANDGLRGIDPAETRRNLQEIIDKVRVSDPATKIILCGMMVPPNMGPDYGKQFQVIYPELAEKNNLTLIPFLLNGVAGEPELNLGDGIHPTVEGHKIVMENVWEVLCKVIETGC